MDHVRRLQEKEQKKRSLQSRGGETNDPKEGYNLAVKIKLIYLEERPAIEKCEESALYRSAKLATLLVIDRPDPVRTYSSN